MRLFTGTLFALALATLSIAQAQLDKPAPDEIVFTNGDKLEGHFVRATGAAVTFKSDILGDLTVDWKKVKELRTSAKVAVVRKGVMIRKNGETSSIPQGTLVMEDQKLQITAAPGQDDDDISSTVEVTLKDGRVLSQRITEFLGTPGRPLTGRDMQEKFRLLTQKYPAKQMDRIYERVQNLESEPNLEWLRV